MCAVMRLGLETACIISTEYTEHDMSALEDAIAQFYTDTFFIYFGHVAVIPTCLE